MSRRSARLGDALIERSQDTAIVFILPDGRQVPRGTVGAIELRSAGAGWPWIDQQGNSWTSAGGPVNGEAMPRWCLGATMLASCPYCHRSVVPVLCASCHEPLHMLDRMICASCGGSVHTDCMTSIACKLCLVRDRLDEHHPITGKLNPYSNRWNKQ